MEKYLKEYLQMLVFFIPAGISTLGLTMKKPILYAISYIMLFIIISLAPVCRHRECLWTFVLTPVTSLPLNIYLALGLFDVFKDTSVIYATVYTSLIIFTIISIQTILMCLITRICFKRQYRIELLLRKEQKENEN